MNDFCSNFMRHEKVIISVRILGMSMKSKFYYRIIKKKIKHAYKIIGPFN